MRSSTGTAGWWPRACRSPCTSGRLSAQVNEVRRLFAGRIDPGDAFIVNHPYRACQNHATDVTIVSPVFDGGRIVAFIGNIAHKPDLGGKVPGTNSGDATDLFQEGLLIPPLKIQRRGEINDDLREMITANTRTPEVTWGDINAQINTNTYGLQKCAELFGKFGVDKVLECWARWMDICEAELRREIARGRRTARTARRATGSTTTASTSASPIASARASRSRATPCISCSTAMRRRADRSICARACRAISSSAASR